MSTCRGCWSDGLAHLPDVVTFAGASEWVLHPWSEDCPEDAPHLLAECGLFDPPRLTIPNEEAP